MISPTAEAQRDAPNAEPAWRAALRRPLVGSYLAALFFFVVTQAWIAWTPAYHDGRTTWEAAEQVGAHLARPFVYYYDVGHPPFVAWLLALLWRLPIASPVHAMHLLMWTISALFVASVFEVGRRLHGARLGLFAAALSALHPIVYGHAGQLCLDNALAAFAWAALLAAQAGSPAWLFVCGTGALFSKLNGMFVLGPFMTFAALALLLRGEWRRPRRIWSASWPLVAPLALLGLYTAIKWKATGHATTTGEFEEGKQTALVGTLGAFRAHLVDGWWRVIQSNGNRYIGWTLLAAAVPLPAMLLWRGGRARLANLLRHVPSASAPAPAPAPVPADAAADVTAGEKPTEAKERGFWARPLAAWETLLLVWLMFVLQWSLQCLREVWPLLRYFTVCYPALYLTLGLLPLLYLPRRAASAALLALGIGFGGLFVLQWHWSYADAVSDAIEDHGLPRLGDAFYILPGRIPGNHEDSMQWVDHLALAREGARWVDTYYPEGTVLELSWPFDRFLGTDAMGFARRHYTIVFPWREPDKPQPQLAFGFSAQSHGEGPAEAVPPPGMRLLKTFLRGSFWLNIYGVEAPPEAR